MNTYNDTLNTLVPIQYDCANEDDREQFEYDLEESGLECMNVWGGEMKIELCRMMIVALDTKEFCSRLHMTPKDVEEWREELFLVTGHRLPEGSDK
jgi:hypothetical protein